MSSKAQLRRQLIERRQSLPPAVWRQQSQRLCQQLRTWDWFRRAGTVLAYFSIRQEPDLQSLFGGDRRWGFSRCVGQSLTWHFWAPGDPLIRGTYQIPEPHPTAPRVGASQVDLLLIPAVACDRRGYRLGYGGGFYDRLLSQPEWAAVPTAAILFDFAYLPEIPIDSWDRKVSAACTEVRTAIYQK